MKKNIAFFGSSKYSLHILSTLVVSNHNVSVIITQPSKPVGRKKKITTTPVAELAQKYHIPQITPDFLSSNPLVMKKPKEFCQKLASYKPDILILAAYGQIIPVQALNQTPYGGLNIHPSFLPKYPGAAPAQWAILRGEKETGVTIIKMDAEIDRGSIVAREKEPINSTDTAPVLYDRLFKRGAVLLIKILPDFISGKITPKPQGFSHTLYARKLKRIDGYIPFPLVKLALAGKKPTKTQITQWSISKYLPLSFCTQNIALCLNRALRAFTPWPGVWTKIRIKNHKSKIKEKRLKILEAHVEEKRLILDQVQLEGKKPVPWQEFKRRHPSFFLTDNFFHFHFFLLLSLFFFNSFFSCHFSNLF